jgi:glutathione S-transferase
MILIGQYDSPFVRRVGIALAHYGIQFEHRPWSVFRQTEQIKAFNPMIRVPTLVLDDGEALLESHAILDYLDSLVAPEQALYPREEPARRQALRVASLACGMGEKAVAMFYEKAFHDPVAESWVARCRDQITGVLRTLEADRALRQTPYWFGDRLGHADIAVAAAIRFVVESHPGLITLADFPAVAAHCARMEALPVFQQIAQPFIPPA